MYKFDLEEALSSLEDHPILQFLVLSREEPGAIGAGLAAVAVLEDPLLVYVVDAALHSGQVALLEADVALVTPPYQDRHLVLLE